MTSEPTPKHPARSIPRLVAYPLLIALPIASVYGGIKLGSARVGAGLMLASQQGTPVENWTLSLIALSIALFMYASWAYGNRTLRAKSSTFVLAATYIVVMFVFGAYGLFAVAILSLLLIYVRRKSMLLKKPR